MPSSERSRLIAYPIVTDSGIVPCGTQLPITVVPNSIIWKKGSDYLEVQPTSDFPSQKQLFYKIEEKGIIPSTSGAGAGAYITAYTELAERGAKEISVFTLPKGMSVSYESAITATEQINVNFPDLKFRITSMNVVSEASRFLVQDVLKNILNSKDTPPDIQKIINQMLEIQKRTHLIVGLGYESLKYAIKGGRINLNRFKQITAELVQIKTVVKLENGELDQRHAVLTPTYGRMLDKMVEDLPENPIQIPHIAVIYTNLDLAQKLHDKVEIKSNISAEYVAASPDLSVHAGPDAVALGWQTVE
jgi:DegV family protein with EDD domain